MGDPYNSDEDFVLPPLPSKPQKSLFSFFGTKIPKKKDGTQKKENSANVPETENASLRKKLQNEKHTEEEMEETTEQSNEEESPIKPVSRKHRRKRCVSSEDEDSTLEVKEKEDIVGESGIENKAALCMEPISTWKSELVKCDIPTPFPVCNHTLQEEHSNLKCITKLNMSEEKEESGFGMETISKGQWRTLMKYQQQDHQVDQPVEIPIIEKPVEEWLQELETAYPDIPVQKIFQQYLLCQKKVIMTDLKRIQASKSAVDSIWNKQAKVEEAEQLALEAKKEAEEKEKRKEGKDIRKMFSTKRKKSVPDKVEVEEMEANGTKSEKKEVKSKEKKQQKKNDSEDISGLISLSGLFGKAMSNRRRGRSRKMAGETSSEQVEPTVNDNEMDDIEPVIVKNEGKDIAKMFAKNSRTLKKEAKTLSENSKNDRSVKPNDKQSRSEELSTPEQELPAPEDESTNKEQSIEPELNSAKELEEKETVVSGEVVDHLKKRKKKKRGLDFLKIKLKEPSSVKDKIEIVEQTASRDIRSMFAKVKESDEHLVKIKRVEVKPSEFPKDELCENTKLLIEDSTQAIEIALENSVEMVEDESVTDNLLEPVGKPKNLIVKGGLDADEKVHTQLNEKTLHCHQKNEGKTSILSFFSSESTKFEKNYNSEETCSKVEAGTVHQDVTKASGNDSEKGQTQNVKKEESILENIQESNCQPQALENIEVKTEHSVKQEENDNDVIFSKVTPCKVTIKKISSPTACIVVATDILPLLSSNTNNNTSPPATTKRSNKKRKRSNSQNQINCNKKKQRQNENNEPLTRCRLLRTREKPTHDDLNLTEDNGEDEKMDIESDKGVPSPAHSEEKEDEKENLENVETKTLRRSSRSRRQVNYSETIITEPVLPAVKQPKSDKKSKKTIKLELDDSVCEIFNKEAQTKDDDKGNDRKVATIKPDLCFPESPKKSRPVIELVLDEPTMNSFLSWTEKYQPIKARYIIGDKFATKEIFNWLCSWKEKHESIIKKMAARANKNSSKRRGDDSDSDSDSESDDEELLSNTLVLTGPTGCGTTATVSACAKQMDFKILELNPTIYRTGKRVLDLVSEAVVSHQIHKGISKVPGSLGSFFNGKVSQDVSVPKTKATLHQDMMSLVLVEQADIIYEEHDKGFWQGMADLRRLAKRPIILTANDDRIYPLIHVDENMHTEQIRLSYPSTDQILPMMQVLCLVERVFVPRSLLQSIIEFCKNDVRMIMIQLQFWFEQGKDPLFKSWRKEQHQENEIVTVVDDNALPGGYKEAGNEVKNSPSYDKDGKISNTADDKDGKISTTSDDKDSNISNTTDDKDGKISNTADDKDSKVSNTADDLPSKDKKVSVKLTAMTKFPVYEEEKLLNWAKIPVGWSPQVKAHFSFAKPMKEAGSRELIFKIADTIENRSELDAFLEPNRSLQNNRDEFVRATMVDSLSEELWTEKGNGHLYPATELCSCVRETSTFCYDSLSKQTFDRSAEIKNRPNKYRDFYTSIGNRLPLSSHLDRSNTSQYTIPYLRNMCLSEEIRRTTQNKRRQRRFLHYLDTTGMCLDNATIEALGEDAYCSLS